VLEELGLLLQISEGILQQVAGLVATGLLVLPSLEEGRLALFMELAAREEMREPVPPMAAVGVLGPAELVVQQVAVPKTEPAAEGLVIPVGHPASDLILLVAAGL
jgi:hypothetical protein